MAAEDMGALYNTKMPGYEDAADIQAALKLFLYGDSAYNTENTNTSLIPTPSLARHLQDLRDDVTVLEDNYPGSEYSVTQPTSPEDGFIWVDGSSVAPSYASFATAVYTNAAPTEGLVDGLIWIDKDASPQKAYVYNSAIATFVPFNELENTVDSVGDILYGDGDNSITKLSIGTEGQVLTVESGIPAWKNTKSWVLKSSGSLSGSSLSVSGLAGEKYHVILKDWSHDDATNSAMLRFRFNNDAGPNYVNSGGILSSSGVYAPIINDTATHDVVVSVELADTASSLKPISSILVDATDNYFGYYKNTNEITSVQISLYPLGSFDAGTYQVWSYE